MVRLVLSGWYQIPREDLALLWELPAEGKPVRKALSPTRAMKHLDLLLSYHGLTYVDAFIMEIPWNTGGEVCPSSTGLCAFMRMYVQYDMLCIRIMFLRTCVYWRVCVFSVQDSSHESRGVPVMCMQHDSW